MSVPARQIPPATVPRLPRGVRLRFDETRQQWMLLAPERILKLDAIALEILKRCDGVATLDTIVQDLAAAFQAERSEIEADVDAFLRELANKRMLDL